MGKKIDWSNAVSPESQPILEQTLEFMEVAARERSAAIALGIMGAYTAGDVVILYGCLNSGSGLNYIISAGAVYYNGEVYDVPAATFTASVGQVAVGNFVVTQDPVDPIKMNPSGTLVSVHDITKLVFTSAISGTGIKDFSALKTITSTRSFLSAVATAQTISATSWTDVTSLVFTTPNDGKTRLYAVFFKSWVDESNSNAVAYLETRIQNVTLATTLDIISTGKTFGAAGTGSIPMNANCMYIGYIAPNTQLKVQAQRTTNDCTLNEMKFYAVELF